MKRLGKKQLEVIGYLTIHTDRYIQVFTELYKEDIWITDEHHNDYLKVKKSVFKSLLDREIIYCFETFRPTLDIEINKFKLK